MLWQTFNATGEEKYRETTRRVEDLIAATLECYDGLHRDVGFMFRHSAMSIQHLYWANETTNYPWFFFTANDHADAVLRHIVRATVRAITSPFSIRSTEDILSFHADSSACGRTRTEPLLGRGLSHRHIWNSDEDSIVDFSTVAYYLDRENYVPTFSGVDSSSRPFWECLARISSSGSSLALRDLRVSRKPRMRFPRSLK